MKANWHLWNQILRRFNNKLIRPTLLTKSIADIRFLDNGNWVNNNHPQKKFNKFILRALWTSSAKITKPLVKRNRFSKTYLKVVLAIIVIKAIQAFNKDENYKLLQKYSRRFFENVFWKRICTTFLLNFFKYKFIQFLFILFEYFS